MSLDDGFTMAPLAIIAADLRIANMKQEKSSTLVAEAQPIGAEALISNPALEALASFSRWPPAPSRNRFRPGACLDMG